MAYQMKSSPAQLGAALRVGAKLINYGRRMFSSSSKAKKAGSKINKVVNDGKGTVTEIRPSGTQVSRNSWPNVKPGDVSDFPGTTTLPSGKVIAFDATKRQILKP